jgi:hypothetical protein
VPSPKRRPCSPKAPRSEDAAAAVAEHHYQVKHWPGGCP